MNGAAQSISHAKFSTSCSPTPVFHSKASLLAHNSVALQSPNTFLKQIQGITIKARKQSGLGAIHAAEAESTSINVAERWLLEPIGDGDTRHIGFKVKMPDAFEIASSEVTVGRLPDKADLVIPVATVSGIHARIQKKGGNLLVTDLDSTNGTFVGDKRLKPGVVAAVSSGSSITFGDTHLAMFRVSKLENVEDASKPEESEGNVETDGQTQSNETS